MQVGRSNTIPDTKYSIGYCLLPNLTSAKDLGVTIDNKLNFTAHIYTYANETLGHYSIIDYMFCSDIDNITKFVVIDEGIYLSDHKPVMVNYLCEFNLTVVGNSVSNSKSVSDPVPVVERFRWDHANVLLHYNDTDE